MKRLLGGLEWRSALGFGLGAAGGAAYSLLVGCKTGGCFLTANPWIAGAFGGLFGAALLSPSRPAKSEAPAPEDSQSPRS